MLAGEQMVEGFLLVGVVSAQCVEACQLGSLQQRARNGGVRTHQLYQIDVPVDPCWRLSYQVSQADEAAVLPGSAGSDSNRGECGRLGAEPARRRVPVHRGCCRFRGRRGSGCVRHEALARPHVSGPSVRRLASRPGIGHSAHGPPGSWRSAGEGRLRPPPRFPEPAVRSGTAGSPLGENHDGGIQQGRPECGPTP